MSDNIRELPNVLGSFELSTAASSAWIRSDGVFEASLKGSNMPQNVAGTGDVAVSFNASRSSSIYKNISKIQIRSCYALMIIKD